LGAGLGNDSLRRLVMKINLAMDGAGGYASGKVDSEVRSNIDLIDVYKSF